MAQGPSKFLQKQLAKVSSEFKNLFEIGFCLLETRADGNKYFEFNGIDGSIGEIPEALKPDLILSCDAVIRKAEMNDSIRILRSIVSESF